ncbi:MAG: hypothetical protein SGPRY_010456 [Prymnesium sp.]
MVSVPTLMLVALCAYIGVYVLFYKKLVPVSWWLPLSKCYFYPMMLPSYLWRLFVVKGTYFSDVDSKVLLGAVPLVFAGHVDELHQRGVRTVIVSQMPQRIHNMQAEYEGPLKAYAAKDPPIRQLHIPVVDHTEASQEQLQEAVNFIVESIKGGDKVLVHCKGGSFTPQQAQHHLNSIRDVRKKLYLQGNLNDFYSMATRTKGARVML